MNKYLNMTQLKALAFMLFVIFFAACKEDSIPEADKSPTFPEATTLSITKPGETATFEFEANYPWTLSVSRSWCKFVDGDEQLSSYQGVAGEYTVEVIITDDVWVFEDQTAVITMGMTTADGTETKEIVTIVRSAKDYTQSAYGATETDVLDAENPLKMEWYAHGGSIQKSVLNFTANYDWKITSTPEWLELDADLSGSADDLVTYECSFITTAEQRNALDGEIVFSDENGVARFSLPVSYDGYPETKVAFEIPSAAGVKFNYWYDVTGANYWYNLNDGSKTGETEGAVYIKVKANENQDLHVLTFAQDASGSLSFLAAGDRWFSVTEPNAENDYTINIQPTENTETEERAVKIVVLTGTVLNDETINGDAENLLVYYEELGITTFKDDYASYAALAFTQEAVPVEAESVFTVLNAYRNESYVYEEGDALIVTALSGEDLEATYGTTNVYECVFNKASDLTHERLWITASFNLYSAFTGGNVSYNDKDGNVTTTAGGWSVSPSFYDPAVVLKITTPGTTSMQIRCTIEGEVYVLVLTHE